MKKEKIRVIYKRVAFDPVEVTIDNTLEQLQFMIGGFIETVRWPAAKPMLLIVDEEGKIDGRPVNFPFRDDVIVGSVLWCSSNGEDFDDCPYNLEEFRIRWPWLFEEA